MVKSFAGMFFNCVKLKHIDLSNIDTSKVENMFAMFQDCHELTSLDITHFNTSLVTDMNLMFDNCISLTSLNLSSFKTSKVLNMKQMFYNCHKLISLDLSNFIINSDNIMDQMFFNCSSLKFLNLENAVPNDLHLIYDKIIIYSNNINWINLLNGAVMTIYCFNNENENHGKKCVIKMSNYENSELYCAICGDIYEQKNFVSPLHQNFIECYQKSKVETTELIIFTTNNKIENLETTELIKVTTNTYTNTFSVDSIDSTITTGSMTIRKNINYLLNHFNKSDIDNGNDYEMKKENINYTLTNTKNQKNIDDNKKNKTIIILGKCEIELKNKYNISDNDTLYIVKLDIYLEGMKIPKIEYEVYYPFYNETLEQLNLSFCQGMKIELYIPVEINDDLEKNDPKSNYYKDICSTSPSDSEIDIPIFDRQNLFIDNNMTLCEEDCDLVSYDSTTKKVQCSCRIKIRIPLLEEEIKFDKQLLKQSFTDIKNIINLKVMKCYKNVFIIKKLTKNYGFYLFVVILIIFFISFILFYAKYYSILKDNIKDLIDAKNYGFKQNENNINIDTNNPTLNDNANKLKKSKKLKKKTKKRSKLKKEKKRSKLKKEKKYEEILKLNENELNSFDYKEAILYDKSFIDIFILLE